MRKQTLLIVLMFFVAATAIAQNGGYSKGDKLLNVGLGINSYYNGGVPVGASFEVGIDDNISIGGNFDYLSYKYNYSYSYNYKFTALYFGVRASYHANDLLNLDNEKMDLYGGATLGYRSFTWTDSYSYEKISGSYGSGVYLGAYVGGKYYFNKKIGAFAELGAIGSTNARVGAAFKF